MLKKEMPNAKIEIGENTLQIVLVSKFHKDISVFEEFGLKVFVEKYEDNQIVLVISPSGIPEKKFNSISQILKLSIEN